MLNVMATSLNPEGEDMAAPRGNSDETKARILTAARRLFADEGIASVSIRDIASAAGVSHGLVQKYFGTRKQMISEIIRAEIESSNIAISTMRSKAVGDLSQVRQFFAEGMPGFTDYARVIARAELGGFEPEKLLDPTADTPTAQLAGWIADRQTGKAGPPGNRMDPMLVSAYVAASSFAFAVMPRWIMASVGFDPEDYESRRTQIEDLSIQLIALAIGEDR